MICLKRVLVVMLVFAAMVLPGALAQNELQIVCTSFPCYDFARAVAGDLAQITMLIKPGAEVHSYEPTPADVMAIAGCDLFVYVGGESDAWVLDILESFGEDAPETLRFFECVEPIEAVHHDEHGHDVHEYDEHIWTSPKNALRMVDALAEKLCEIAPETAASMRENADAYLALIGDLDASFEAVVAGAARKEMIFADRFPFLHFAREYDLEWYAAFDSCSSESEPSAKTMMALIDRIVRDGVPVVFKIELSSGKTAEIIAEETGG